MQSIYVMFENLWSGAFGISYTEAHSDLIALLSTATTVMVVYGIFKLFVNIGKKVLPK